MIDRLEILASEREWKNWEWQQRNRLNSAKDIKKYFPNFPVGEIKEIEKHEKRFRWGITPYTLSLMKKDSKGNPEPIDPIVKQTFPIRGFRSDCSPDSYDGNTPNWELPEDMVTPILQHKYTEKVLFRFPDSCLGYCGFCFEVERVEDKNKKKQKTNGLWEKSLDYIRKNPQIREVILSGGEPLLLRNEILENRLKDISSIPHVRATRLHTRALTFNPFRFDEELIEIIKKYSVNELGLHITHPNELSDTVEETLDKFDQRGYGSILKNAQIPLLKGINDNEETLKELFLKMYADFRISPYYLLHGIPWSPSSNQYRTSVKKGVELINRMKRQIPNVAMPEYIIVHHTGKHTVPLEPDGTPEFQYTQNEQGYPIIRFKNWKDNWETYLDGKD
jgi:lysine 2,3-aminomutase